jgi:putative phosphoesterase
LKIAILSDIHGNIYALDSVLIELKREKVETIIVLGDTVGYYYHPEKVLDRLGEFNIVNLKGNHEEMMESLMNNTINQMVIKNKYGSGIEKAINNLSTSQKNFLINAPKNKTLDIKGLSFFLSHESPIAEHPYIYPNTKNEIFEKFNSLEFDFVLFGHSHYPFVKVSKFNTIINPGSVGQSRKKGGTADWVIINLENKVILPMTTSYSTASLLMDIKINDPNNVYLEEVLTRNCK